MKNICLTIFSILLCVVMLGCGSENFSENTNKMAKYDTPYTKCVANNDGTYSLYIYSAPIQFKEDGTYKEIDTALVESVVEGYGYENKAGEIKVYIPKCIDEYLEITDAKESLKFRLESTSEGFSKGKLVEYQNLYGDEIRAVSYQNEEKAMTIYVYATFIGIQVEYVYKNHVYPITTTIENDKGAFEKGGNGYTLLKQGKEVKYVVSKPIAINGKEIFLDGRYSRSNKENFTINYELDASVKSGESLVVGYSVSRYVKKIPDTNISSKLDKNVYLRDYSLVGDNSIYGTSLSFMRFRINYYLGTTEDNIIEAEYVTKLLYSDKEDFCINMYKNEEQWSSTMMTWSDYMLGGDRKLSKYSTAKQIENNYVSFELTSLVKEAVEDIEWMTESLGCCVYQDNGGFTMFASSENPLYIPYLRIDLEEEPERFSPRKDVNEEIWTQENIY